MIQTLIVECVQSLCGLHMSTRALKMHPLVPSPQLWSHMPLSPAATLEYSGGPPSRKRYTRQEFLQLTMSEDSDDNGMASEQVKDVCLYTWTGRGRGYYRLALFPHPLSSLSCLTFDPTGRTEMTWFCGGLISSNRESKRQGLETRLCRTIIL